MKKTVLNKEWLFNKNGELCGIALGSDFCAEHECGINLLKAAFHIDGMVKKKVSRLFGLPIRTVTETNFGIVGRMINTVPAQFVNGKIENIRSIGYYDSTFSKWADTLAREAVRDLKSDMEFVAYWCDRGFFVASRDTEKIDAIANAFNSGNIAIFIGGRKFISNGSLIIAIATKLDDDVIKSMYDNDQSVFELERMAESTGIRKKLDKAGIKYYALSPKWTDDTKTAVHFWLNPCDQANNNYGYFTVAELEQWINGEGPIIKK